MRIITLTCSSCGTIVAGNELERNRAMKCPGLDCHAEFQFADLSPEERTLLTEHRDRFKI